MDSLDPTVRRVVILRDLPAPLELSGSGAFTWSYILGCLNLPTNAVVTWNTVYMAAALNQLWEDDLVHLSPARYEPIAPYVHIGSTWSTSLKRCVLYAKHNPGSS